MIWINKLGVMPRLKKYYLGCFPADVKPQVQDKCCWIWNVDEQDKSGTHWVGVIKENDKLSSLTVMERRQHFLNVNGL